MKAAIHAFSSQKSNTDLSSETQIMRLTERFGGGKRQGDGVCSAGNRVVQLHVTRPNHGLLAFPPQLYKASLSSLFPRQKESARQELTFELIRPST